MHDWTLVSIAFDWRAGKVALSFRRPDGGAAEIVADGVTLLDAPRLNEWGPSASVNRVQVPGEASGKLAVEMQSGDVIRVEAASFAMPDFVLAQDLAPAAK